MSGIGDMFAKPKLNLPQTATVRAPDTQDPAVLEEGKRRRRIAQAESGRDSTNLSGSSTAYSNSVLGA